MFDESCQNSREGQIDENLGYLCWGGPPCRTPELGPIWCSTKAKGD